MDISKAIKTAIEHLQAGNLQEAEYMFKDILMIQPDNVSALHFLGVIYYQQKNCDSSIEYIKKALQFAPDYVDAYNNLGIVLQQAHRLDEAILCYQKALELKPHFDRAYYNLGTALKEKGLINDAIHAYRKALEVNPMSADAYTNLGNILLEKGQDDEAIDCFHRTIQFNPNYVPAYYGLASALVGKWRLSEAIDTCNKLLQINANDVLAYYLIGSALRQQGKSDEAVAAYDKAISINSANVAARLARCISQLPIIYPSQSSIKIYRNWYSEELSDFVKTLNLEDPYVVEAAAAAVGTHQPFYLPYQGLNDRDLQQLYGNLISSIMSSRYPQFADRPSMPAHSPGERLKVGIVSGYFYHHSNWKIPIKGWIENLDRDSVSLYGYYTGKRKDADTEAARKCFIKFVEDIYSFEEFCRIIRGDNLHILIYPEIGMDAMTARLASLCLAPVQCASWGHPDTSGFPTIDYYLSSDLMEPPDADDHYTEKLIRLPNLSVYYTPPGVPHAEVNRDTFGLHPESILYLCCQSLSKYLPQYDEVYPLISQQVSDCQFIFISHRSKSVTEQFRTRLINVFNRFNMQPDEYIIFLPRLDPGQYHALNCLVDIYLDGIGWSGCNSTFEAIACNLPIVTLPGGLMRGRHSSAILTMIGLKETIATDLDEYISLAVRLGQNSKWRQYISDKISKSKHLAYRDRTCIAALEDFFERVVKKELSKLSIV
jgi:protein O-GlcNAc transferase